ncbi:MAG: CHRD domain-containing protein [Actinomycetota bacterium]
MDRLARLVLTAAVGIALAACGNTGNDEGGDFQPELSGADEVCSAEQKCGDPDGSGSASVEINSDRNELCYDITLSGISGVTAAHIHKGASGEPGDVVLNLEWAGTDTGGEACLDGVDEGTLERISKDPVNHYVNVHTSEFPDGAVRGQLKE